jgi:DinB superfamily
MAIDVLLEVGDKRTFASAADWPGWSRAGRDVDAAIQALVGYAERYATVLGDSVKGFRAPRTRKALAIAERLPGDATTDFGAPGVIAEADGRPVSPRDLTRLEHILRACWAALDAAAAAAADASLRTGPRGGGRDLSKILAHVRDAQDAYGRKLGGAPPRDAGDEERRAAFLAAVASRARGEVPDVGPRGGSRWPARYGVRRAAWHVLDHAWEIEDRSS